jgi:hypothetical protein
VRQMLDQLGEDRLAKIDGPLPQPGKTSREPSIRQIEFKSFLASTVAKILGIICLTGSGQVFPGQQ